MIVSISDLWTRQRSGLTPSAEFRQTKNVWFFFYSSRNFQLAIARRMLGHSDDRSETLLSEQRQAFSSLRAIKAGRRVANVRTGHRVREYLPGTVPQTASANHAARSSGRIQIYQVRHIFLLLVEEEALFW